MPKRDVIYRRLSAIDEYLRILRKLQKYSLQEFLIEPERYGSAERFLQLCIEALSDAGNHVIAESNLGTVDSYADIPDLLFEKGYIAEELRSTWIRMIGFRNILVHEYLEIDRTIVYDVLQRHVADIEAIQAVFAQFL
jgi:uncharacterized protein YutE (UPF0331/DUF86 family)